MLMKFDTLTAADYAAQKLASLLERATRDTEEIVARNNIPETVTWFAELKTTVQGLQSQLSEIQKHIDLLSGELIPTMFTNQNKTQTIRIENVGRVTVNDRWSCSMLKPDEAFFYIRKTGNAGMIKDTVHPMTLGAWGKDETLDQRPPPPDIFKVTATPYVSITKG
jgi:hypothetical protein